MKRDPRLLANGRFDLLVIGGGIYGAWTAYDAALRGLKVALIEKGDWASGTSSASSKLIHGGLRYLEQMRFGLVKRSLAERARLARLGPHRVAPIRFLVPVYRGSRVGRFQLQAGLWLYDRFSVKGPVGPHQRLSERDVRERYAHLRREGLQGGFTYGDCVMDDALFTLEIVAGAHRAGATAANYVRANRLLIAKGAVTGAAVTDEMSGETFEIQASVTVNATGMWLPSLGAGKNTTRLRLSKGIHVVLPGLNTDDAILAMSRRDTRVIFVIPWYGKTLLGTTDADYTGDPDRVHADDDEIDYLLDESAAVIGEPRWNRSMIEGTFAGVRALKFEAGTTPSRITREWVLESPSPGLLESIGGKFTSARADASVMVNRVFAMLTQPPVRCETANRPFPWAPLELKESVRAGFNESFDGWMESAVRAGTDAGLDPEVASSSARRYGSQVSSIHMLARRESALAERIDPRLPFARAELVYAANETMAVTLEDLLRRRTPVLILSSLDRQVIARAADVASPILGWNESRRHREVAEVVATWGRPQ